jgi:hypothetical protein
LMEYRPNPSDHMEPYLVAPPLPIGILFANNAGSLQVIG